MLKRTIVFVYNNIVIGGVQTLLLRLVPSLQKNGNDVVVYCKKIYQGGNDCFHSRGVKIEYFEDEFPKELLLKAKNREIYIIVFEFELYWRIIQKNKQFHGKANVFLYSVHPYTTDYYYLGLKLEKRFIQKIFSNSFSKFIRYGVLNGHIFFMDEETLKHLNKENNVGLSPEHYNNHIVRLLFETNKDYISKRTNHKAKHLLTVCRADFPFKGYLKGLIELYSLLKKDFENLELTIISSGPNIDELIKWIENQKKNGVVDISILVDVPYDKLHTYYEQADVYIGMGTTILEAAACGAIAIPVAPYTYECNTFGLFSDNPEWVLTEIGEGDSAESLLRKILLMSDEEKNRLSLKAFYAVESLYSEKKVLKSFDEIISRSSSEVQYDSFPLVYLTCRLVYKEMQKLVKRIIGKDS